ncbi:MAG: hypothetical protein WD898_00705, partial [Candidatus Paceibacterota bacterium]
LFTVFLVTLGAIFISENSNTPSQVEGHAEIIQTLKESIEKTATPSPISRESLGNPTATKAPASVPTASSKQSSHIFYTSSNSRARYYYCDTDSSWKSLSREYLREFSSEAELLKNYERELHKPC